MAVCLPSLVVASSKSTRVTRSNFQSHGPPQLSLAKTSERRGMSQSTITPRICRQQPQGRGHI
jgi:hypothetical protein